jgi:hypothetical protein
VAADEVGVEREMKKRFAWAAGTLFAVGSWAGGAAAQWAPTPGDPRGDGPPPAVLSAPLGASPRSTSPGAAPPAQRTERARGGVEWRWQPMQTWEYVATAGLAGATIASMAIPIGQGRWITRNEVDEHLGAPLQPDDNEDRRAADDASDILLALGIDHLLFDSVVVGWGIQGRGDVGYQMAMIDVETLTLSVTVTTLIKSLAARERPYGTRCNDPARAGAPECAAGERYKSFFSGHAATAFTVAGLNCMHHTHIPLYGGGAPDALACVGSLGAATAVGFLRVRAFDHYPTDVLTGAAFGTAVGLGLPWLLHYRKRMPAPGGGDRSALTAVRIVPTVGGGAIAGVF